MTAAQMTGVWTSHVMSFVVHQTPAGWRCASAHITDVVPGKWDERHWWSGQAAVGSAIATCTDSNGLFKRSRRARLGSPRSQDRPLDTYRDASRRTRRSAAQNCV